MATAASRCADYAAPLAPRPRELSLRPRALKFSFAAKKASAKSRIAARSCNEPSQGRAIGTD